MDLLSQQIPLIEDHKPKLTTIKFQPTMNIRYTDPKNRCNYNGHTENRQKSQIYLRFRTGMA
jgi:hypothetical protein